MHLGHLYGALSNWIKLQEDYECFYFVADWHALTTEYGNTTKISADTIDMTIDWLSAGLDPAKSTIFVQSQVPEHAELHLLLSMITPLPWLERCPTYKEQLREIKMRDLHTYGFLGYPVLQAADILIYKADGVPVGEDQLSHLELTREIARRFNSMYGNILKEPQAILTKVPKMPGNDGRKMSKSYSNCVFLSDSRENVQKTISSYITDPARIHPTDIGHPEICPVFALNKVFLKNNAEIETLCKEGKIGCVKCKKYLIQEINSSLENIRIEREKLCNNRDYIVDVLKKGSLKAREEASKTIAEVKEAVKLWNMA